MKEFLKKNWFKLGTLIVVILVGFSAIYYGVYLLPKLQQQNNLAMVQANNVSSNLDAQQKCANQAVWFWKNGGYGNNGQPNEMDSYTDHWNTKLNKCFILTILTWTTDNSASVQLTDEEIYDAYGGQNYGNVLIKGEGIGWLAQTVQNCRLIKNGIASDEQSCITQAEFDNYINPLMSD